MQFLGIDIGSSFIKVSVLDGEKGITVDNATFPHHELGIKSIRQGWAEQEPDVWWENVKSAICAVINRGKVRVSDIGGIGIAYQMHGLVAVDKKLEPVRPSIIWCDSRAVATGEQIFIAAGREKCIEHLFNSPANFTLSKLVWVKKNEPSVFERIYRVMLPGDYIAMKLTGEVNATLTGLSEAILWDFRENDLAHFVLAAAGINEELIPSLVPGFGIQGYVSEEAAAQTGLKPGIPVTYRAGDQPNNAFSLNVLNPGEMAATAGTSGVVYGVTGQVDPDQQLRVNTFAHVNHSDENPRFGVLLCINGAGIANSWIRKMTEETGFNLMNQKASQVPPGSEGLIFVPFGNGAERMFGNIVPGASFGNIDFNIHHTGHLFRSVQEGIAFAFNRGIGILNEMGIQPTVLRAGQANMFLSPLFCNTLSSVTNTNIELYNTDGALGAARGAALGAGFYRNAKECFTGLEKKLVVEPDPILHEQLLNSVRKWGKYLHKQLLHP